MNDEEIEYITDLLFNENWKEQKDLILFTKDLKTANRRLAEQVNQLQSNWNSLREWIEEYLEKNEKWFKQELSDHDKEYYKETYNVAGYILDKILDKMNDLEGVDNENNGIKH